MTDIRIAWNWKKHCSRAYWRKNSGRHNVTVCIPEKEYWKTNCSGVNIREKSIVKYELRSEILQKKLTNTMLTDK